MAKKKKVVVKKKNPNDVTFRNINTVKKQLATIKKEIKELNEYLHTFGS